MKISRQKKVQKHLNFYKNNFKFREPFQVLIDGTFAFAALEVRNFYYYCSYKRVFFRININ